MSPVNFSSLKDSPSFLCAAENRQFNTEVPLLEQNKNTSKSNPYTTKQVSKMPV